MQDPSSREFLNEVNGSIEEIRPYVDSVKLIKILESSVSIDSKSVETALCANVVSCLSIQCFIECKIEDKIYTVGSVFPSGWIQIENFTISNQITIPQNSKIFETLSHLISCLNPNYQFRKNNDLMNKLAKLKEERDQDDDNRNNLQQLK